MNDKELDNYMKTVNPNFDSHIEKGTIEMSSEYYNLLEEKMARLISENQELKNHLKELKNGYKIKLEKLLANGIEPDLEDFYLAEIECKANDYDKLLNQQKEFIKFLEDNYNLEHDIWYIKILQKYKEIIGVSDENN
jgi:hypothetical protein